MLYIIIVLLSYNTTMRPTQQNLPQNIPLYEQVYKLIETRIINGEFSVGDKLPTEKELSQFYKVSRTAIREAIKVLKEKGWVETRVAKGTFVIQNVAKGIESSLDVATRMNPEDKFENLIQVRLILEPEIAALAAEKASKKDIKKMHLAINSMDNALKHNIDIQEFLKGDIAFHMALAESTGNNLIHLIIAPVVKLMRDIQNYHLTHVEGGGLKSQRYHRQIMEAIDNRNPAAAKQKMHEHIVQVRNDIQNNTSYSSD